MSDISQELWDWQESIDSPHAAKLLLVRAIQRLGRLEAVLAAARKICLGDFVHKELSEAIRLADEGEK